PFWDRHLDPVPVEGELTGGATLIQTRRIYDLPFGVVEVGSPCVGSKVERLIKDTTRLSIGARGFKVRFNDFGVAVVPFAFDKLRPSFGGKVDRRLRSAASQRFVGRRVQDEFCWERQLSGDSCDKKNNFAFHDFTSIS